MLQKKDYQKTKNKSLALDFPHLTAAMVNQWQPLLCMLHIAELGGGGQKLCGSAMSEGFLTTT